MELGSNLITNFLDYLICLIKGEVKIESLKISLGRDKNFNCNIAFKMINLNNRSLIGRNDLFSFIFDNNFNINQKDIDNFMNQFCFVTKIGMSYTDFVNLILPISETQLREEILRRDNTIIANEDTTNIKNSLGLIFFETINLSKELNQFYEYFLTLKSWEIKGLFEVITFHTQYITDEHISTFLKKYYYNENLEKIEINLIMKKFDKDNDNKLNLREFNNLILPKIHGVSHVSPTKISSVDSFRQENKHKYLIGKIDLITPEKRKDFPLINSFRQKLYQEKINKINSTNSERIIRPKVNVIEKNDSNNNIKFEKKGNNDGFNSNLFKYIINNSDLENKHSSISHDFQMQKVNPAELPCQMNSNEDINKQIEEKINKKIKNNLSKYLKKKATKGIKEEKHHSTILEEPIENEIENSLQSDLDSSHIIILSNLEDDFYTGFVSCCINSPNTKGTQSGPCDDLGIEKELEQDFLFEKMQKAYINKYIKTVHKKIYYSKELQNFFSNTNITKEEISSMNTKLEDELKKERFLQDSPQNEFNSSQKGNSKEITSENKQKSLSSERKNANTPSTQLDSDTKNFNNSKLNNLNEIIASNDKESIENYEEDKFIKIKNYIDSLYQTEESCMKDFLEYLFYHLFINQIIEKEKENLIKCLDFSIGKLFKIFDSQNIGSISIKEFERTFFDLNIDFGKEEIDNLFSKIASQGIITYSIFFNLVVPITNTFNSLLCLTSRIDNYSFSGNTFNIIKRLFSFLLDKERLLKKKKIKLQNRISWDKNHIFNHICRKDSHFISYNCLTSFLRNIPFEEIEITQLFKEIDADNDQKISFLDFGKFLDN